MRCSVVLAACLAGTVAARYQCNKNPGGGAYPYCVSMPDKIARDNCNGKLPTVIYMGGSGTFGPGEDIEELTTFDGFGQLLKEYRNDNTSDVTKLAAQRFIVFIPLAPATRADDPELPNKHYDPEAVDKAFALAATNYPMDPNRLYTVGYSAGCRGMFRLNGRFPNRPAAAVCVAGGAEKAGSQYLVEHPYPETFTALEDLTDIPTRIFGGSRDETAPTTPKQTFDELVRLGSTVAELTILNNDHEGLQSEPFTPKLLEWLLCKNKGQTCNTGERLSKSA